MMNPPDRLVPRYPNLTERAFDAVDFLLGAWVAYERADAEMRACLEAGVDIIARCKAENRHPGDEERALLREANDRLGAQIQAARKG